MAQTNKAQQNQAGQQQGGSENQSQAMTDQIQKLVAPIAEAVAQLKADKEAEVTTAAAAQEAARQEQLNKDANISTMLDDADVSEEGDDKLDKLSNRQLVDLIAGAVETAMEANATKIKDDISQTQSPGSEKIVAIEKVVMSLLASQGIAEVRGKHEDFDDYREPIAKIMGEISGITFEDAYLLAKSRAAGKTAPKGQVETEKPTNAGWPQQPAQGGVLPNQSTLQDIANRGREARQDAGVTKSGTVGIRNIIREGVNAAMDNKQ